MPRLLTRIRTWARTARGRALLKHDLTLVTAALLAQPAWAQLVHGDAVGRDALVAATVAAVKVLARQFIPVPPPPT